jgi:hypothetical protein
MARQLRTSMDSAGGNAPPYCHFPQFYNHFAVRHFASLINFQKYFLKLLLLLLIGRDKEFEINAQTL